MKSLCKRLMLMSLVLTAGVSQAWFENVSFKKAGVKTAVAVAIGAAAYGLWKYYNSNVIADKKDNDATAFPNAAAHSYQNAGMNLTGQTGISFSISSYSPARIDSNACLRALFGNDQSRLQ